MLRATIAKQHGFADARSEFRKSDVCLALQYMVETLFDSQGSLTMIGIAVIVIPARALVSRDSCCCARSEATRNADSAAATSEQLKERMQATSAALGAMRYLKCCLHALLSSQNHYTQSCRQQVMALHICAYSWAICCVRASDQCWPIYYTEGNCKDCLSGLSECMRI